MWWYRITLKTLLHYSSLLCTTGTCKWFDSKKGFGFISPASGEQDLFVHQSSIHSEGFRSLADGEAVEFEIAESNGRTSAVNVTGPGGAYVQGAPYSPPAREPRQGGGNAGGARGGGGGGGGGRGGGGNFYNEKY